MHIVMSIISISIAPLIAGTLAGYYCAQAKILRKKLTVKMIDIVIEKAKMSSLSACHDELRQEVFELKKELEELKYQVSTAALKETEE